MKFFHTRKTRGSQSTLLRPRRSRLFRGAAREQRRNAVRDTARSWSLWTVGYMFLWAVFLGIVVFVLFFSSLLRIEQEDIAPMNSVAKSDVTVVIRDALSGKSFGLFPNDTMPIVFLRRHVLERKILETFPVFRTATISFVFPKTVVLKVEERVFTLVLCSGGPCFLVDEQGIAFTGAPDSSIESAQGVFTVIDISAKPVSRQSPLFSEDFLRTFPSLRQRLSDELGLETSNVAETPSRFSDELWFRSSDGWSLRMSATVPIEKSILALRLLFAKTISEQDRKNLEYIDLRTENRIFYLLKGGEEKEGENQ